MGWSGGNRVMGGLVLALEEAGVDPDDRFVVYKEMVEALVDMDWDTLEEAMGEDPILDKVIKEYFIENDIEFDDEEEYLDWDSQDMTDMS